MTTLILVLNLLASFCPAIVEAENSLVLSYRHNSAIRVYADFVEWSSWDSTPLALPEILRLNPTYKHEAFFLRLLAAHGFQHRSKSLQGPIGLWRASEIASRKSEVYEFALLGAPEMEFGSTFIRTDSQLVVVRATPPQDASNVIAIYATCEFPGCTFRVVSGGKEITYKNKLTIEAELVQKNCSLFTAFCRYIVLAHELDTVWGANWERTNGGKPDIVVVPPDEPFPISREDTCAQLTTVEQSEFEAEWQKVNGYVEEQCASRKGLELLANGWANRHPLDCISLDEKYVTFGQVHGDALVESDQSTATNRRLQLQAVFYRNSRRCSSVYVSLRK